jgi:hypothetical protein
MKPAVAPNALAREPTQVASVLSPARRSLAERDCSCDSDYDSDGDHGCNKNRNRGRGNK